MVAGDLKNVAVIHGIDAAVTDVDPTDRGAVCTSAEDGGDKRGAHLAAVGMFTSIVQHRLIGAGGGVGKYQICLTLRKRELIFGDFEGADTFYGVNKGVKSQTRGDLTAGESPHAVANHGKQGVVGERYDIKAVLVVVAYLSHIAHSEIVHGLSLS